VLNVADTLLVFKDLASSKKIEQFLVTTTPGRVTLQAAATTLRPVETTTIDAVVQNHDPAGTYEYQWTVSPNANYWVEDRTLAGTDDAASGILVTPESRVNIRSLVTTDGVATVSCTVFRLDGGRRQVGEGSVAVKFEDQLQPYEVPSTLVTKVSNTLTTLDGASRPQYEYAIVSTWVIFAITPGATYKILENGVDHGSRLTPADIAKGAPVFNPDNNYGSGGTWPAPYRANWYNLGNGMAGYNYGSHVSGGNVGVYYHAPAATPAETIAAETARQRSVIGALNPKIFVVP